MIVQRDIIGTTMTVYSAWEPDTFDSRHFTISTIDGKRFGRIGTREHACALPRGEARLQWFQERWQQEEDEAYAAILAEHPELCNQRHKRHMGKITVCY